MRDTIGGSKLVPQCMGQSKSNEPLHSRRPQTHPRCDLQLLANDDVLRVGLRLRQVLVEISQGGVAHMFHRGRETWSVQILCISRYLN